ncbi:DUF7296 family protein [Streptomyces sp. NBC_01751]|uniref:DUF7296 family protein n=1 Tax=Streptomyces sp. NBC_01751 TaxID=2975929 RepID=UPI002DD9B289|nr:hypothetical protein [Streptomyces sp. NBC_01751]WSD24524.1 hypothetical protein OHA26_14105 [Streptomyces sp. NBC_01751]
MSFFTFSQNNSGGGFTYDWVRGISHYVIVEADDRKQAIDKAEEIGLYFDGEGDCSCCGNRWSWPWRDDGHDEPMIYGEPAAKYLDTPYAVKWIEGAEVFVHYADGRIEGVIN